MKLERLNNEKFCKLKRYQIQDLDDIKGGVVGGGYPAAAAAAVLPA